MFTGLIIRMFNERYFRRVEELVLIVVPQVIIMVFLIGYMDILIFIKWGTDYTNVEYEVFNLILIIFRLQV